MKEAATRLNSGANFPRRVFLSHDVVDSHSARRVANFLRSVIGLDVFQRQDSPSFEPWSELHRQRIENSDAVVVLASPHGLMSGSVLGEIGAAWSFKKPIVALTPEHVTPTLPFVTLRTLPFEQYMDPALWRRAFLARAG